MQISEVEVFFFFFFLLDVIYIINSTRTRFLEFYHGRSNRVDFYPSRTSTVVLPAQLQYVVLPAAANTSGSGMPAVPAAVLEYPVVPVRSGSTRGMLEVACRQ